MTINRKYSLKSALLGLAGATAGLIPVAVQAADGFATANVNMRSGPSTRYPAVTVIPVGTPVEIHGCLADLPWCDVSFYRGRGWVAGRYVQAEYRNDRVYVEPRYYGNLGIPTVTFELGNYWDRNYRNRDFYRDRDYWRRGDNGDRDRYDRDRRPRRDVDIRDRPRRNDDDVIIVRPDRNNDDVFDRPRRDRDRDRVDRDRDRNDRDIRNDRDNRRDRDRDVRNDRDNRQERDRNRVEIPDRRDDIRRMNREREERRMDPGGACNLPNARDCN